MVQGPVAQGTAWQESGLGYLSWSHARLVWSPRFTHGGPIPGTSCDPDHHCQLPIPCSYSSGGVQSLHSEPWEELPFPNHSKALAGIELGEGYSHRDAQQPCATHGVGFSTVGDLAASGCLLVLVSCPGTEGHLWWCPCKVLHAWESTGSYHLPPQVTPLSPPTHPRLQRLPRPEVTMRPSLLLVATWSHGRNGSQPRCVAMYVAPPGQWP